MGKQVRFKCQRCGYIISEAQKVQARFDYPCPRCKKQTIEFFLFEEYEDEEATDGAE